MPQPRKRPVTPENEPELPYLSAGDIETVDDLPEEDVPMLEWGGMVRVKALSVKGIDALYTAAGVRENNGRILDLPAFRRALIHAGCIKPKLSEAQVAKFADKSMIPVERLSDRIAQLSGVEITSPNF